MLPWGPDGKWLQEGVIGKVLGDWQVTGVVSAISGTPIDFTANAAALRAPGNSEYAQCLGQARSARRHRLERTCGSIRRSSLRRPRTRGATSSAAGLLDGPAYYNLDASIVKIIRVGTRRAEIRADFFNALNIPHYANPNGTLGNANFGRITGILAQTERTIRFGGRFLF